MVKQRQSIEKRREDILEFFTKFAEKNHYRDITRELIAEKNGCSPGRVSAIFGNMERFKDDLIKYALYKKQPKVVCQAISDNHPAVKHLKSKEILKYFELAHSG